jgi:hypothetical protein
VLGDPGIEAAMLLGWTFQQAAYVFMYFTRDFPVLEMRVKQVLNGEIV